MSSTQKFIHQQRRFFCFGIIELSQNLWSTMHATTVSSQINSLLAKMILVNKMWALEVKYLTQYQRLDEHSSVC